MMTTQKPLCVEYVVDKLYMTTLENKPWISYPANVNGAWHALALSTMGSYVRGVMESMGLN